MPIWHPPMVALKRACTHDVRPSVQRGTVLCKPVHAKPQATQSQHRPTSSLPPSLPACYPPKKKCRHFPSSLPATHHKPSDVAGLLALVVDSGDPRVPHGDRLLHHSPVLRAEASTSFFDQRKSLRTRQQQRARKRQRSGRWGSPGGMCLM